MTLTVLIDTLIKLFNSDKITKERMFILVFIILLSVVGTETYSLYKINEANKLTIEKLEDTNKKQKASYDKALKFQAEYQHEINMLTVELANIDSKCREDIDNE